MKKIFKNKIAIIFFICFVILAAVWWQNPAKFWQIGQVFKNLILQLIPVLGLVFLIMFLINYFFDKNLLEKNLLKQSPLKKWVVSILAGILSVGPVYVWYPLMQDLQEKNVENRYIACFLYNRGIKLHWVTILIFYFGLIYVLILFIVMTLFSIPQGIITEKLINKFSSK